MTTELSCREVVELVTDLLEGVLPPAERDAVLAHLTECDDCTTYLRQMEQTVALAADLRGPGPDQELVERLRELFRSG